MKRDRVSIVIACCLVSACAQGPFVEVETSGAPVVKPNIPENQKECVAKGGHWGSIVLPGTPPRCDLKATDGGKICNDSSQCQGECMAPEGEPEGTPLNGTCSEYILNFGCARRVEHGKVGPEICAD